MDTKLARTIGWVHLVNIWVELRLEFA